LNPAFQSSLVIFYLLLIIITILYPFSPYSLHTPNKNSFDTTRRNKTKAKSELGKKNCYLYFSMID